MATERRIYRSFRTLTRIIVFALIGYSLQLQDCMAVKDGTDILHSGQILPNGAYTCYPGKAGGHGSCGTPCRRSFATPYSDRRVRREIRSLGDNQWQAVVNAIWVMKETPGVAGVAKYGDAYRPYDYFVAKHMMAVMDPRGDQAHLSAVFGTWHAGLVLEFENSLLSVDPSIEGLPYWDITLDNENGTALNGKYLGSFPGTGPNNTLGDGGFAQWPVSSNFSLAFWANYSLGSANPYNGALSTYSGSPAGFLRLPDNYQNSSTIVRYGRVYPYTKRDFWSCINLTLTITDWSLCIQIGKTLDGENITKDATPGDISRGFHPGPHIAGGQLDLAPQYMGGDFKDIGGSPNDPIFMFHHANTDRSRMWYQEKHANLAPVYWGFPATNSTGFGKNKGNMYYGMDLHDVSSAYWPFNRRGLGLDSDSQDNDKALTHANLLCILDVHAAPYIYDDMLEIYQCTNLKSKECSKGKYNPLRLNPPSFGGLTADDYSLDTSGHEAGRTAVPLMLLFQAYVALVCSRYAFEHLV